MYVRAIAADARPAGTIALLSLPRARATAIPPARFCTQDTTVGAAFQTKLLTLPGALEPVKVELWDTAGQERYRSLAPMYYRGAQAAVVVFDVTSRESFEGAKQWVRELQKKMDKGIVIALAANKVDLASRRKVERDEAELYAQEMGLLYAETSAKDATNIEQLFLDVAARVPKTTTAAQRKGGDVDLASRKDAPKAAGGCCG